MLAYEHSQLGNNILTSQGGQRSQTKRQDQAKWHATTRSKKDQSNHDEQPKTSQQRHQLDRPSGLPASLLPLPSPSVSFPAPITRPTKHVDVHLHLLLLHKAPPFQDSPLPRSPIKRKAKQWIGRHQKDRWGDEKERSRERRKGEELRKGKEKVSPPGEAAHGGKQARPSALRRLPYRRFRFHIIPRVEMRF
ncbi:hypothetical protein SEVIR_3G197583v4 [Setaria viridis]